MSLFDDTKAEMLRKVTSENRQAMVKLHDDIDEYIVREGGAVNLQVESLQKQIELIRTAALKKIAAVMEHQAEIKADCEGDVVSSARVEFWKDLLRKKFPGILPLPVHVYSCIPFGTSDNIYIESQRNRKDLVL